MASVTDYFAPAGAEEYQSSLFKPVRAYHVYKDVWDPYLGDGFTKHDRNNSQYAVAVLPVDCHCHSETVPPWRMNRQHSLDISLGKCPTVLVLFTSTDRTATAYLSCGLFRSCFVVKLSPMQVRIPHVLVNVVATYDTHKSPLTSRDFYVCGDLCVFNHLGFARVDPVPL